MQGRLSESSRTQTFSLRNDSKLSSSPLSATQGLIPLHPARPVPRPSPATPSDPGSTEEAGTHSSASLHLLATSSWAGSCTGETRQPRLPQPSGLACPRRSAAEAEEEVTAPPSLVSAFPLHLPQAQGTPCSSSTTLWVTGP